jgi:acyl-CoA synthetase (AMP-forming)/AMP-acid ligase II
VAIRDPAGRDVPRGTAGDVWLRTSFPRRYFRDDDGNQHTFRSDWVRMGDIGYLDHDDFLYLVDREQDVVKSGARRVSTIRIEAALFEHRDISDAAVVGVSDPVAGAMLRAVVVVRDPTRDLDLADLRSFLLARLAPHEIPAEVVVLDRLPRNTAGKVRKNELRDPRSPHAEGWPAT